jgi:hypothetical protein
MNSFAIDDYIKEMQTDRRQAIWVANLSDGTSCFMDDGRPGVQPYSAWVRLKAHLEKTGLSIDNLRLQFRSNIKSDILPAKASAYFFCKSALGHLNSADTLEFFLVGVLQDGKLRVQRWNVPELILVDVQERDVEKAGECLIKNP